MEIVITKFLSRHFPEVTALITTHLHCVHNLELGSVPRSCMPAFTDIMRRDMPALRTLQVYFDALEDEDIALELPPACFPRLTGVLIANIQILATPAIVSQLREIRILVCRGSSTPITTATFVHAIRAMRNVKVLHLRDVYACDAGSSVAKSGPRTIGGPQTGPGQARFRTALTMGPVQSGPFYGPRSPNFSK